MIYKTSKIIEIQDKQNEDEEEQCDRGDFEVIEGIPSRNEN